MPRRTDEQTLLEELLSVQSWPVYFYKIQVKDEGMGVAGSGIFTCADKVYDVNEWQTAVGINDAKFIDEAKTEFTIGSNAVGNVLNLSGTPVTGEFTLEKWIYLVSIPEEYEGSFSRITYPEIGDSKYYLPYPVEHGPMEDHELGQFPQLQLVLHNPDTDIFDFYRALEKYDGLKSCIVYVTMAFIDHLGNIYDDPDITIVDKFIVNNSTITQKTISLDIQSTGALSEKVIPTRNYSRFTCDYAYKDEKCKYDGDIERCTKLYNSLILNRVKVVHLGNQVFEVPEEYRPLPTGTTNLVGCRITTQETENTYLWKITANTTSTFTTTSDPRVKNISDYISSGNEVVVSVIDKFSCLGHTDTGSLKTPSHILLAGGAWEGISKHSVDRGNLLTDSKFEYGVGVTWGSNRLGATIEARECGVIITKNVATQYAYLTQLGAFPANSIKPQYNHHYQLYLQYYGYTISGSVNDPAYITIDIGFNFKGTWKYYNFTTKVWVDATSQFNRLYLRNSSYAVDLTGSNYRNVDDYIKPDEFSIMIPLDWSISGQTAPFEATDLYFRIGTGAADNVRFRIKMYRAALYRYLPYEHAGSFPGIPLTQIWYV